MNPRGENAVERVLWMSLWVPGPNGRRGLPLVLVGDPGTAKTARCRQLSKEAGLPFSSVLASIRQPSDFLGMPMLTRMPLTSANQHLSPEGDSSVAVTRYAAPAFALDAATSRRAVILLDEVNTCPPSVQAALLRLLFEGVCGELEMPSGVRMLLAMNETEDAAGGWDISLPLANRVGWVDWPGVSLQAWSEYMVRGGGCAVGGKAREFFQATDPAEVEARVDAAWVEAWARAVGLVDGFIRRRPEVRHKKPKAGAAGRAWPSGRTWDFAACGLAGCEVFGLGAEERGIAVAAFVGSGVAAELFAWERELDLPDPADVLSGAVKWEHDPKRMDRTAAVLSSCATLTVGTAKAGSGVVGQAHPSVDAMWSLLLEVPTQALDLAVGPARALVGAGCVAGSKSAYKSLARLEPLLEAVGM